MTYEIVNLHVLVYARCYEAYHPYNKKVMVIVLKFIIIS